jgi:hypothetical protein
MRRQGNHKNTTTYVYMKTHNTRKAMLAALAVTMLSANIAPAALTYTDGDLILGFRATGGAGGNTNVLFNLGNASVFRDATSQFTLSLGNVDSDLDSVFGSNWNTRLDLNWSISGTQFAAGNGFTNRTLIASRAQGFPLGTIGTSNSTAWNRGTLSAQGAPALKLQALGGKFGAGTSGSQTESTNSVGFGLIQPQSENNSFEEYMSGGNQSAAGASYAYFSGGIEGSFANGASGTALDLYIMQSGSGAGSYEGTFTISDNATITFTPTGVPEPGSAFMLAIGLGAILTKRRRAQAA